MGSRVAEDPIFGDLAIALAPRAIWPPSLQARPADRVHVAFRSRVLEQRDPALWSSLRSGPTARVAFPVPGRRNDEGTLLCLRSDLSDSSAAGPASKVLLETRDREWAPPPALRLMGVVNVTPDSFSDGGRHLDPRRAIDHGLKLSSEGADLLDVGGESTRPGSSRVPEDEEIRRVVAVVAGLAREGSRTISIDTTKAPVARAALDAGATIVNDVSAGRFDDAMLPLVAERRAGFIAMHMQGTPQGMQADPTYVEVVADVLESLRERCRAALEAGVDRERLWIDPGIGFGKTLGHNLEILGRLSELRSLGLPVCVGVSRKSFIAKLEEAAGVPASTAQERVGGTAAALTFAVLGGASILRVHDVAIMAQAARVARALSWKDTERP